MAKILKCNCVHKFQDRRYGKGNRVHTEGQKGGNTCTVCKAQR